MAKLRDALDDAMQGWKQSLPIAWKSVFQNVTLDAESVSDKLKFSKSKPVFPVLRPPRPKGSPSHAHTFRAFQNLKPNDVRVVIVGQDPYPNPRDATGQSFEQGGIIDWVADSKKVAKSLRPILRHAAYTETGDRSYRRSGGWARFIKALENEEISMAPPGKLFDCYNQQGVIWLNTTFTLTEFEKSTQQAHFAY